MNWNTLFNCNLNDTSEKATQPESIKTSLKPHQLTSLKKMIDMENTNRIEYEPENNNYKYILDTNIGILADDVGYGKTLTALSILDNKNLLPNNILNVISSNTTCLKVFENKENTSINICLVPHNIFFQWKKSIENHTLYKFSFISKKKDIITYNKELNNNILISFIIYKYF